MNVSGDGCGRPGVCVQIWERFCVSFSFGWAWVFLNFFRDQAWVGREMRGIRLGLFEIERDKAWVGREMER